MAQVVLELAAVEHGGAHGRLEESIGPSPFLLGAVKRGVGMQEERLPVGGVLGAHGDPDADRDRRIGFRVLAGDPQALQDVLGNAAGQGRAGNCREDDGEFVAAQPRQRLAVVEHAQDPLGNELKRLVAGPVSEQVVDLLESIEVEEHDGERPSHRQRHLDLLVQFPVEGAPIGQPGERVVKGKKAETLFRLLARPDVADRDGAVRLAGEVDRAQDEFDRCPAAVGAQQVDLDGRVRTSQQFQARGFLRKAPHELGADQAGRRRSGESHEAVVDRDDRLAVADQEPFDRGVGQAPHPVVLEFAAPPVAHLDGDACQGEKNDHEARQGHRNRERARRHRGLRKVDRRIGDDRRRGHRGEMQAADRQGQQHRAEDSPAPPFGVQADRQRDRADQHAEHDRRRHQGRVPDDPSLDFERRHADVVHRGNGRADDGAAQPRAHPDRRRRDGEARAGQQDRGNQREARERDIVGVGDARRERQHGDEMRRPDPEAGRRRGNGEPHQSHAAGGPLYVMEQADGRYRGKGADRHRQADEAQVVFGGDAVQYFQERPHCACSQESPVHATAFA